MVNMIAYTVDFLHGEEWGGSCFAFIVAPCLYKLLFRRDWVCKFCLLFFGSLGQPKTHSIELIQISKQEKGVANELRQ